MILVKAEFNDVGSFESNMSIRRSMPASTRARMAAAASSLKVLHDREPRRAVAELAAAARIEQSHAKPSAVSDAIVRDVIGEVSAKAVVARGRIAKHAIRSR